jgi:HSP20 family molecular chaperone IbpA
MRNTTIQKRENQEPVPERIEQTSYFTPLVDIIDTDDEFVFEADLPGVKAGDVDITYDSNVLTIQGKVNPRQPQNQKYIWQEYGVGHFYRQFTLHTPINADAIKAELKNGVLELRVPKSESAKTRKIQITTA